MKPVLVLRHVPHESLGTIADAFQARAIPLNVVDLWSQPFPAGDPEQWSGLVVMGGPMNVDEVAQHPFLAAEVGLIQQALAVELPILGVCLGSQLFAKALGSKVFPNPVKEIGWYEVELLPAAATDPLFAGLPPRPTVFQWHGDTFDPPSGAVQLARSPLCPQQAFRFGRAAYGLQFHMEMTAEMVNDWLCEPQMCGELARLDYLDAGQIRRETAAKLPPMRRHAGQVFGRFAQLCAGRSG